MKKLLLLIIIGMTIISCNNQSKKAEKHTGDQASPKKEGTVASRIDEKNAIAADQIVSMLQTEDSLNTKLTGEVVRVCQHSGCWLDIKLNDSTTMHITFSDPDKSIPKDSKGKTAVIEGIAIKELISVKTLKNYAREEGKSQAEIDLITTPEYEYNFEASGILLKDQ